MRRLGTDLVSVACILGGAVVAGGVTLAAMRGAQEDEERVEVACAVEVAAKGTVVSLGDGRVSFQTAPSGADARGCVVRGNMVRVHLDESRRDMERARADIERARRTMDREMGQVRVIRLDREASLEAVVEQLAAQAARIELQEIDVEADLARKLEVLESRLSELRESELRVRDVSPSSRAKARPGGGR